MILANILAVETVSDEGGIFLRLRCHWRRKARSVALASTVLLQLIPRAAHASKMLDSSLAEEPPAK